MTPPTRRAFLATSAVAPLAAADAPVAPPPRPAGAVPFTPVVIPAWVEETIGAGYTLSAMDSKARAEAARHGVTLSETGFVDPFYAYYDSKLLRRRSPHVPPGKLAADLAEYKRLGVRVLGVYPPTLQGEVYELHPDWRRVAADTTDIPQIDLKKYPHGGMLCPLGPYGDFFIDVLAEIVTTFPDVAAFSFDGLHHGGYCYCRHCRDNYRADAGAAIPKADLNDPAFRRYQRWADRRLELLVERMQRRLKGIKPDIALVTWTTNAGRFGHFLSIPRNMPARLNLLFDAPDQELWLDETNRGNSIVPAFGVAYAWAVTGHRVAFSEPYLMSHGNPYGKDGFPAHEVERRMLMCVAHGCRPSIAVAQPARLQTGVYQAMDEVQRRKAWLTRVRPEKWAALLMSDDTKTFYGRSAGRVEDRYLANVFGTFRACVEEHLPTTVVNDWDLSPEGLAGYAVLVLPNAACLSDRQAAAVRAFVAAGGGLVASLDTSLFDENGDPRPNFALADVFGADYRGLPDPAPGGKEELDENFARALPPDYWEKRRGVFDARLAAGSFLAAGKLATLVGLDPVTFKGPAVRVRLREGATAVATLGPKGGPGGTFPAVVTRAFGKGRVAYLAAGFDAAYYLYPYPYQRLVLAGAIRWAAGDVPQPVTVAAPMCVHATTVRQRVNGGEQLVVHLFNDLNTAGGHAHPADDVPLREEVVPIADIRVTIRVKEGVGSVRLEPDGLDLAAVRSGEVVTVTVPRLVVHTMVVVELVPLAAG
ncbi:MAG TPA: alpha-amylase family protein [Urbifossiella sp.]|jgi:hypothetical protein|nr:alpha-amylase family protein [Urbifossiella sp.]